MIDLKNILISIFCVIFIAGCTNNEYILIEEKKSVIQPKVNEIINEKEEKPRKNGIRLALLFFFFFFLGEGRRRGSPPLTCPVF